MRQYLFLFCLLTSCVRAGYEFYPKASDAGSADQRQVDGGVLFDLNIVLDSSSHTQADLKVDSISAECTGAFLTNTPFANSGSVDGSSAANAYVICTAQQWQNIGSSPDYLAKYFRLANDIDLKNFAEKYAPIGNEMTPFAGYIDGAGHTIANLAYHNVATNNFGLFGYVELPASIKNLTLANFDVQGNDAVGFLVGYLKNATLLNQIIVQPGGTLRGHYYVGTIVGRVAGTSAATPIISNITVNSTTVFGVDQVGAVLGEGYYVDILDSQANNPIVNCDNGNLCGGFVGEHYRGRLERTSANNVNVSCQNMTSAGASCGGFAGLLENGGTDLTVSGLVNGTGTGAVGGLTGETVYGFTFSRILVTVDVTGNNRVGGIIGVAERDILKNCRYRGTVIGNMAVGGIIGAADNESISECQVEGKISGITHVGGIAGSDSSSAKYQNNYVIGTISGTDKVGGILGTNYNYSSVKPSFKWNYVKANITASTNRGGIIGYLDESPAHDTNYLTYHQGNFWLSDGANPVLSVGGGNFVNYGNQIGIFEAVSDANLKKRATFETVGFDFTTIWSINEGVDYPRLLRNTW